MKLSKDGYKEESKSPTFLFASIFKSHALVQRRALLQLVKAEERIRDELAELEAKLVIDDSPDLKNYIESCVSIMSRNSEHKRLALLQIVRDIEKRYPHKRRR